MLRTSRREWIGGAAAPKAAAKKPAAKKSAKPKNKPKTGKDA
jgi:hypothetical protein